MGVAESLGHSRYPEQGRLRGEKVIVTFDYDLSRPSTGVVIRDDMVEPFHTVISLEDGRVVMGVECQYKPFSQAKIALEKMALMVRDAASTVAIAETLLAELQRQSVEQNGPWVHVPGVSSVALVDGPVDLVKLASALVDSGWRKAGL